MKTAKTPLYKDVLEPGYLTSYTWPLALGVLSFVVLGMISDIVFIRGVELRRMVGISVSALAFMTLVHSSGPRLLARSSLYLLTGLFIYYTAVKIPGILSAPAREWDFLCFYLDARVAAEGLNLYAPESYQAIVNGLQLNVSSEFQQEVLNVGFKYPPPTALLFLPLSLTGLESANFHWLAFVILTIVIAILMISRLMVQQGSARILAPRNTDSIVFAAFLMLSMYSTRFNISVGQTTGLLSCFVVLTLLSARRFSSGVFACCGVFVKPIAALPALLLLLGRYWSSVTAGVLAGLFLIIVSYVWLGADDWSSYLRHDYATASPAWLYLQDNNKSLLAVLSRAFGISDVPWGHWPVVSAYSAISLLLAAPSIWLAAKIARRDFRTAYCLLLLMGLIIYPGTQTSYGMLLVIPIAVEFWAQRNSREHELWSILFCVAAITLSNLSQFIGTLLIWFVFVRRGLIEAVIADHGARSYALARD